MLQAKIKNALLISLLVVSMGLFGCNSGDTDGGEGNDDAGIGDQFVSDGGAGASIKIDIKSKLSVGGETGFTVSLTAPDGSPLAFIRIFCESEKGIAILEPSSGGVAFEHTGSDGVMSGRLGGLLPGSFILECRAPQGFNLVDRTSITITGEVPPNFAGFPGAAGGNLGGGVVVNPDTGDIAVTNLGFVDDGTNSNFFIDLTQTSDCDGDVDTNDPEPFFETTFRAVIDNPTAQRIFINSVVFTIFDRDPEVVTSSIGLNGTIAPDSSGTINGPFAFISSGKRFATTSTAMIAGTYTVRATFSGTTEGGGSFTVTESVGVSFNSYDRCPSS